MLCTEPAYFINGSFAASEKKFRINFSKKKTKSCFSLDYNHGNSYFFVNGKKSTSLKPIKKNIPTQFCLGSISNRFGTANSRKISLKGNIYDFSVDYSAIDTSDISNIDKYLSVKDNIRSCLDILSKCLVDY